MDHNWTVQPSSSQPCQIQGQDMTLNLSMREPTPSSVPLHDDSQDNSACNNGLFLKTPFASTLSTSESTGSTPSSSQRVSLYGSQMAWSSVESFPSVSSNSPTIEQYRALVSQFNELKQENLELGKHNRVLNAKLDSLTKAYEMLTNHLPQLFTTRTLQQESRETYPNVKYWTCQEWTVANADRVAELDGKANIGARGRTRAANGINVNMKYIEDKDGNPVNGHLASDMRRHACAIFVGLAREGQLFTSWTEADHSSLKTYYHEMAERFEELRLCAHDWKAEMIALDIYRTWRKQWQKKNSKKVGKGVKDEIFEDDQNDSDDSDEDSSLKHGIDDSALSRGQRATKKMKSDKTPDPASGVVGYATSTAANLQLPPTHIIPNINIISGTLARVNTVQTNLDGQGLYQPMPSLQQPFNIINPLRLSSSNTMSKLSPLAAIQPQASIYSSQPAPHVSTFVAFDSAPNNAHPQPTPAGKSRWMRPTKSITARNLCAIDWCKENKGTSDEFNKYWNSLPKEEKDRYEALSKERSEQEKAT